MTSQVPPTKIISVDGIVNKTASYCFQNDTFSQRDHARARPHKAIAATVNFRKSNLEESTLGPMFHEYTASTLHSPVREPIFQVAKRSFRLGTSVLDVPDLDTVALAHLSQV